ncbi:MAG: hypothetical protein MI919_01875, partial [Holophagales bacterium]|nr:hypothetical protein [Holophagales bacterium]
IILLSDGLETCSGDPCGAVRSAKEAGTDLLLHVVGFDLGETDLSQLHCMAAAGGGLFLPAENAAELAAAFETAVALGVDTPAGRLSVRALADGHLQDVSVRVARKADGVELGVARTYTSEDTNPTSIPLADGEYSAIVRALGLKGDVERRFELRIENGGTVEKEVDYSTGELEIAVGRNAGLGDAVYKVYVAGTTEQVVSGRTYTSERSNPARARITAGRYDVKVTSTEIASKPAHAFGTVEIEPRGKVALAHTFESGTLSVGTIHGEERIDCVVYVIDPATGKTITQSRTYTGPPSNPKDFELVPGIYRVKVKALGLGGKPEQEREVEIVAGKRQAFDFSFGS